MPKPVTNPNSPETTNGWNLSGVSGPREEVRQKIQAAEKVPTDWKTALCAAVDAQPASVRGVSLHAHCQQIGTLLNFAASVKALY